MPIIHRRVFFGKAGVGDQLAQHVKEGSDALARFAGVDFKPRTLTDNQSGRTDRVVMEWQANSLGEIDAALEKTMANPQGQTWFPTWFQKLTDLIHYAEVENWTLR